MKKTLSVILVLMLLLSAFVTVSAATTYGDVNTDGMISGKDAVALMQYINGWELEKFDSTAADVNLDGKVNNKDCIILLRYINGWDVQLGDDQPEIEETPEQHGNQGPLVFF